MSDYIKLGEWLKVEDYEVIFSRRWTGVLDPRHPENETEDIMAIVRKGEAPEERGSYE